MEAKMQTLSTLSAAALLALVAGCAGPSQDAELESVSAYPEPAEPVELPAEPEQDAEDPAEDPDEGPTSVEDEIAHEQSFFETGSLASSKKDSGYDHDYTILVMGGSRMLSDDWSPVDDQFTGGANFMARGPGGWFHWDVSFFYGEDDSTVLDADMDPVSVSSRLYEIDAGVAKIFDVGILRPYVGIGAAYVNAEAELGTGDESVSDDESSFGGYGRAGVMIEVTESGGLVGLEARYLFGTSIGSGDFETDVDGLTGLFTVGFSW